ncbi:hypothetical protein MD484_g484, partial [Candolleomyces efflorescens]
MFDLSRLLPFLRRRRSSGDEEAPQATLKSGGGRRRLSRSASGDLLHNEMISVLNPLTETSSAEGFKTQARSAEEFRTQARIWTLYLEDASARAKEKVGLFAGIVSGFIIDARGDIQSDSEQNLLSGIWNALRQPAVPTEDVAIPSSSKWIYVLWLLSLQLTLFSAIMGVLARGWLEQFAPAVIIRPAEEACRRYRLDRQVALWHVDSVITLIPLFVQIASFLFLVGLILRCFSDDGVIGYIVLAISAAGGLLYVLISLLHVLIPSSPFHTPLSLVFSGFLWVVNRPSISSPHRSLIVDPLRSKWSKLREHKEDNEVLGTIFRDLIKSLKPEYVDEAASEIAHPFFKIKWIQQLCKDETSQHLLSRLERCAATTTHDRDEQNRNLRNHLLAFLRFVHHFEEALKRSERAEKGEGEQGSCIEEHKVKSCIEEHKVLLISLEQSLAPTHPINRWNTLDETLRPLLFGLRAQVLILIHSLPEGSRPVLEDITRAFDFDSVEMSDRPWELAFRDIRSQERLYLMLSACRGVLEGQRNLKTASIAILCLRLAKAGYLATEIGNGSEAQSVWEGNVPEVQRDNATRLIQTFLFELFKVVVKEWHDSDSMKLLIPPNLSTMGIEPGTSTTTTYLLELLISDLSHPNHDFRTQAITMLVAKQDQQSNLEKAKSNESSGQGQGMKDFLQDVTDGLFEMIVEDAVCGSDRSAQEIAMDILKHFVENREEFQVASKFDSLKWLTESEQGDSWRARKNAILVSEMFMEQLTVSEGLLKKLFDWAEKDKEISVRRSALEMVTSICCDKRDAAWMTGTLKSVITALKQSITPGNKSIIQEPSHIRKAWTFFLKDCIELHGAALFADALEIMLELGAKNLDFGLNDLTPPEDQPDSAQEPGKHGIGLDAKYCEVVEDALKQSLAVIEPAKNAHQLAKMFELMRFVSELSRRPILHDIAEEVLKGIGNAIHNAIQCEPVLRPDYQFAPKALKDVAPFDHLGWIYLAARLTAGGHYPLNAPDVAATIFGIAVKDDDDDAHLACLRSLALLARSELCNVNQVVRIKDIIKNRIDTFLKHDSEGYISEVRIAFIELLSALGNHDSGEFCKTVVKKLTRLASVKDGDPSVQIAALDAISNLTRRTDHSSPSLTTNSESEQEPSRGSMDTGDFNEGIRHANCLVRQAWVKFAGAQIKDANSPFLNGLLGTAIIDEESSVRKEVIQALLPLLQSLDAGDTEHIAIKLGHLSPPIAVILPKALDDALDLDSGAQTHVREAAIRLVSHLNGLRCSGASCKWTEEPGDSLAITIDDEKIVTQLANLAVKSRDKGIKQNALRLLKDIFLDEEHLSHLRRPVKASLQKVILHSLNDHEFRSSALDLISNLTSDHKIDEFRDFFQSSIPFLMRALLVDLGDKDLHDRVKKLLKADNLPPEKCLLKLNRDFLNALPPLVTTLRSNAEEIALWLVSDLPVTGDVASSIAGSLSSMLRHGAPSARAITLKLLNRLYDKYGNSKPLMVDSAIHEVVALALDDKNNEIWEPALSLLIARSSQIVNRAPTSKSPNTKNDQAILSQIGSQNAKFIACLESANEDKRYLVVELLSLVSHNAIGRLSLKDQAADFIVIFLAHTVVSTSKVHSQYRRDILTALWCHHGSTPEGKDAFNKLGDWFALALFGRRASLDECKLWQGRCSLWLKLDEKATQSPVTHDS